MMRMPSQRPAVCIYPVPETSADVGSKGVESQYSDTSPRVSQNVVWHRQRSTVNRSHSATQTSTDVACHRRLVGLQCSPTSPRVAHNALWRRQRSAANKSHSATENSARVACHRRGVGLQCSPTSPLWHRRRRGLNKSHSARENSMTADAYHHRMNERLVK